MGLWIKWATNAHKDAMISRLTDLQFRAVMVILSEAKELRKGGEFRDRRHLAAVIGPRLARAIPTLIAEGFLNESQSGLVSVSHWSRWQVDATATERQQRHRAEKGLVSRISHAREQSRAEQNRAESLTNTKSIKSVGEIMGVVKP
jgi:hypothetical protein